MEQRRVIFKFSVLRLNSDILPISLIFVEILDNILFINISLALLSTSMIVECVSWSDISTRLFHCLIDWSVAGSPQCRPRKQQKTLWSQSIFQCCTQTVEQSAHYSERASFRGNFSEEPEDLPVLRELDLLRLWLFFFCFFFFFFFVLFWKRNEHTVSAWTHIHTLQVFIFIIIIIMQFPCFSHSDDFNAWLTEVWQSEQPEIMAVPSCAYSFHASVTQTMKWTLWANL